MSPTLFTPLTLLTYFAFAIAVIAGWIKPLSRLGFIALLIFIGSSLIAGLMSLTSLATVALGLGALWMLTQSNRPWFKVALIAIICMICFALATHQLPGFARPLLFDQVLGQSDTPYLLYLNIDKAFAAWLLLAMMGAWQPVSTYADGCAQRAKNLNRRQVFFLIAITVGIIVASGFLLGVPFDKKPLERDFVIFLMTFIAINGLITCVAEELFFRGVIQNGAKTIWAKSRLKHWASPLAIASSAILFAAAHCHPSPHLWKVMALVTIAGLGYGYIYDRCNHIAPAIITHLLVNAIHVLAFQYPLQFQ